MSLVSFQNADSKPVLKNRKRIKEFIPTLFAEYGFTLYSLTIVFCSDEFLLSLNQKFLQHNYYTDILTFDLSSGKEKIGEIYISIDRVKENARLQGIFFQDELLRIIFHGVLHLFDVSDKNPAQKADMTKKENDALAKFKSFHVKQ